VKENMWMECKSCWKICEFAWSEKLQAWYCLTCLRIQKKENQNGEESQGGYMASLS